MAYASDASWATAQKVRLTWLVQVNNDVPCDPTAATAASVGCTSIGLVNGVEAGFIYDMPQVVQTYYTDWNLTGLAVTEEHGTKVAVAYEDPTADDDVRNNAPSWLLNKVLMERFLSVAPGETTHQITIANAKSLLDHRVVAANNTLYDLPNTFNVDTNAAGFATQDEALHETDFTAIPSVLSGSFGSVAAGVQPWITTLYSSTTRSLSLDAGAGYTSTTTGANNVDTLQLNFGFGDGTPTQVVSGVKATPFCATGGTPKWKACTLQNVWDEIDLQTGSYTYDPDNPDVPFAGNDPILSAGERRLAHIYAAMMMTGQNVPTQITTAAGRVIALNRSYETSRMVIGAIGTVAKTSVIRVAQVFYLRAIASAAGETPTNVLARLGTPAGVPRRASTSVGVSPAALAIALR